mmetsp:Transcript_49858/g.144994  ORF Transcript_49858/g.144994 Transcript_49858/m.144994 type:complete len:234 (+) Transcript_49858:89-790(+)
MTEVKGKSRVWPSGRLSFIQRQSNSTNFGYERVCSVAINRAPEQFRSPRTSVWTHFEPDGNTFTRVAFFLITQERRTRRMSSSVTFRPSARMLAASTFALARPAIMLGVSAHPTGLTMSSTLTPNLAESLALWSACLASTFRFAYSSSAPPPPCAASSFPVRNKLVTWTPHLASVRSVCVSVVVSSTVKSRGLSRMGPPTRLSSFFSKSCTRSKGREPRLRASATVLAWEYFS